MSGKDYHSTRWINELRRCGMTFEIVVLESGFATWEELCAAERRWIAFWRAMGCPLTNMTDGGDGVKGLKKDEAERERMRERQKALLRNADYVRRMLKQHSPEVAERFIRGEARASKPPKKERDVSAMKARVSEARRGIWTGPSEEQVIAWRQTGMTWMAISKECGRSVATTTKRYLYSWDQKARKYRMKSDSSKFGIKFSR